MGVLKQWLPYVLSGISAGGQYALIAVGYTMVYGILRLINFAHGDIFMVAGLIMGLSFGDDAAVFCAARRRDSDGRARLRGGALCV